METTDLGINGLVDIEQIGRGGSSRVYRARQPEFDRQVALKVLTTGATSDGLERFDRERKALGRLSLNPGVVPVYSSGTTDADEPFLVMPFYQDGSLADRMAAGPLRWTEAVDLVASVARTISAAHQSNVVHLDIKPANVLLTADGSTRIADFGIAKVLRHSAEPVVTTGTSFTPSYSAPEIVRGETVTTTADVYGLGATLWALLAGRPPFRVDDGDNSVLAVTGRVIHSPVGDLRHLVPSEICDVVEQAMAKDPGQRFPTASAFARALSDARRRAERGLTGPPNRLSPEPPSTQLSGDLAAGLQTPTIDLGPTVVPPGDGALPAGGDGPGDNMAAPTPDDLRLPPLSSHAAADPIDHELAAQSSFTNLGHEAYPAAGSGWVGYQLDTIRGLADRTPNRHLVAALMAAAAVTIGTLGLVARSAAGTDVEGSNTRSSTSGQASTTANDARPGSVTTGSAAPTTAEATVDAGPAAVPDDGIATPGPTAAAPGSSRRPASRPPATSRATSPPTTTRGSSAAVRPSEATAAPTDPPASPTTPSSVPDTSGPTSSVNPTSAPTPPTTTPSSGKPSTTNSPPNPPPTGPPSSAPSTGGPGNSTTPPSTPVPPSTPGDPEN
ncbi:MAG: protein kinase domain-containing protein [Acidimicrobiales bacterium]